jgi:uncharacterized protein (TIGR00297 family)
MPAKAIPPRRDQLQSRVLVWLLMPILCAVAALVISGPIIGTSRFPSFLLTSVLTSGAFALVAWRLKAATPAAATCGGIICLLLTYTPIQPGTPSRSGLAQLLALFILTFAATRAGRTRKVSADIAESRRGRNIAQVIANLGVPALIAIPGFIFVEILWSQPNYFDSSWVTAVLVLSALAEATADTVSSEIGQAFGGRPLLVTTLRRVEPGTDGAISLRGTLAGLLAAAIVAAIGAWSMHLSPQQSSIAFAAGICGLFFDSLLGATLERRGWMDNDLVNFCSTVFSPAVCLLAIRLIPGLGPHPFVEY